MRTRMRSGTSIRDGKRQLKEDWVVMFSQVLYNMTQSQSLLGPTHQTLLGGRRSLWVDRASTAECP
jgi:hypothetical protein